MARTKASRNDGPTKSAKKEYLDQSTANRDPGFTGFPPITGFPLPYVTQIQIPDGCVLSPDVLDMAADILIEQDFDVDSVNAIRMLAARIRRDTKRPDGREW